MRELISVKKYYEVIEKSLQLLETIEEGLIYIQKQLEELRYEEGFTVLKDAMEAIVSIESAIHPMKDGLQENCLDVLAVAIKESMKKAINSYENGKELDLGEQIEKEILPSFMKWKEEVERVLNPYILS